MKKNSGRTLKITKPKTPEEEGKFEEETAVLGCVINQLARSDVRTQNIFGFEFIKMRSYEELCALQTLFSH